MFLPLINCGLPIWFDYSLTTRYPFAGSFSSAPYRFERSISAFVRIHRHGSRRIIENQHGDESRSVFRKKIEGFAAVLAKTFNVARKSTDEQKLVVLFLKLTINYI